MRGSPLATKSAGAPWESMSWISGRCVSCRSRCRLPQVDDLLEGWDLEQPVQRRVLGAHQGQPLLGPQRLELCQGEVEREPGVGEDHAVDRSRRLTARELGVVGDVGGGADVGLVAGDELAVLGEHQVGLDVVGPHLDRERVRGDRVLGAVGGAAPVADDDWQAASARAGGGERGRCGAGGKRETGKRGPRADEHGPAGHLLHGPPLPWSGGRSQASESCCDSRDICRNLWIEPLA